jgi:predicted SnoaL-like aldol condensation-catalyzing enzyme
MANSANVETAKALVRGLTTGDKESIKGINPNRYIQHNLMAGNKDGLEGFLALHAMLDEMRAKAPPPPPDAPPPPETAVRAFEDGDYVCVQVNYSGRMTGFDVYRFENGKIVEHWDNIEGFAEGPNLSGHTQLDGPTEATDLDKTAANKALVDDFVRKVLLTGEFDKAGNYLDGENFIQHSVGMADGVSGFKKRVDEMAKKGTPLHYRKCHMLLGQGDFVIVLLEGNHDGKHVGFFDLYRVKGGKIVEQWGSIQEIPPKEEWAHENGKF